MKSIVRKLTYLLTTGLILLSPGCKRSGWVSQTSGTTKNLLGVWFTNADTGTVVGVAGTILNTTNGGDNWNIQQSGNGPVYWGVRFSGTRNGWIVGNGGTILHTTDGGIKWIQQSSGTSADLSRIFCLDNNIAWIVGDNTILHTTNGGITWTSQKSLVMTRLWDVFFTNPEIGTAVGGWCNFCYGPPYYGGYILHTTDGGENWTIQKHDTTIFGFYGIFFTDVNRGTIVGAHGTILNTTDGGITWTEQSSGTISDLWDVCFVNSDTGTVVGGNVEYADSTYGGTILRTTNGGITWVEQEIPSQNALCAKAGRLDHIWTVILKLL